MPQTLDQFFHDFQQEYLAEAEAAAAFQLAAFMESVAEEIRENGDLEGFEFCHYDSGRGSRVDGYWLDDEGCLGLFVADFDFRHTVESLTQTEVVAAFNRAATFFRASFEREFYTQLEPVSPEFGLARLIHDRKSDIKKLVLFLVSERRLSDRAQAAEARSVSGIPASYEIWDIARLHRLRESKGQREPLEIDFEQQFGRGVPCLSAALGHDAFPSYLVAVPGKILADLYEKYGARLLEQNVRAFLQNKGNVNKGIKRTILTEPSMFFAYNNGITATASSIQTNGGPRGLEITHIVDLQIVNGGQTTASLFHTRRNDNANLDQVFVQMKLSIVAPEDGEQIVPKIAEYANTQNKVNAADLFSNSPFHIRIEELSRRMWAPPKAGELRETKWFYERARGQYADEVAKRVGAEQRTFLATFPKHQVFNKTDLAKFENVWDEHPRHVNLGAQKNFVQYALRIAEAWEKDSTKFNELTFRTIVARALIFRACEKLVTAQPWYKGGYRANTVAYGIALLAEVAKSKGAALDIEPIWRSQAVPEPILEALKVTTAFVHEDIQRPPAGISNVTEWCKRPACWDRLKAELPTLAHYLPNEFLAMLIPLGAVRAERRQEQRVQVMVDGIHAQAAVVQIPPEKWREVRDCLERIRPLADVEVGVLRLVTQNPPRVPSERQAKVLLELLARAQDEGVIVRPN